MTLELILAIARQIWGEEPTTDVRDISVLIGVIHGDICREARAAAEGHTVDIHEVGKELGNLVLSATRWMDDIGLHPEWCVKAAELAQRDYAEKLRP